MTYMGAKRSRLSSGQKGMFETGNCIRRPDRAISHLSPVSCNRLPDIAVPKKLVSLLPELLPRPNRETRPKEAITALVR
jgi:hypothetical protein